MAATKIVVTVGPASHSADVLGRFVDAGIDVVRLNMSHGTQTDHRHAVDTLRQITDARGVHVAIMADLAGPKVRTAPIDPKANELPDGATCEIVREPIEGTAQRFGTNYEGFVDEVEIGHRVLIDDGQIRLRAAEKSPDSLMCKCEEGGLIGTRKGINVPDSDLSLSAMTDKDHSDLTWAVNNKVDFVALSFVRCVGDVVMLRQALGGHNADIPILAKIETPQAIGAIDGIIDATDGIMVARGDLGVEMDVTQVPLLQKDIVRRCQLAGKPVIIATQMLHSMIEQPTPTRAEVSDVANAALEGADAVMLSGESAAGRYPVRAVAMMNRICEEVDRFANKEEQRGSDATASRLRVGFELDPMTSAVARSAAIVAHDIEARLIAAWCRTGRTARWLSKYHVRQPLIALASDPAVCRRLALSYDVDPMLVPSDRRDAAALFRNIQQRLTDRYGLSDGDFLVLVGDPVDLARGCSISISTIGQ